MAEYLLDSDVVIWHLRGRPSVVREVLMLAERGRIGLSVVTRAEVIQGMLEKEREGTLAFLDACETLVIDRSVADRAGEIVRSLRSQGVTIHLPDALLGATAVEAGIPFFTCNPKHLPIDGLDIRQVSLR